MPSFFFHIALDVHNPIPDKPYVWLQGIKVFQNSIRAVSSHHPTTRLSGKQSVLPEGDSGLASAASKSHDASLKPDGSIFRTAGQDWRFDRILVQSVDMVPVAPAGKHENKGELAGHSTNAIAVGPGGFATKGKFEPSSTDEQPLGWGVVRLYRDNEETPGLHESTKGPKGGRGSSGQAGKHEALVRDEDCTTLCILAVPSYLTPSDFLGFVGEKTRDEVSHFRMIKTERSNRYMVLMKFRSGKKAREWRNEWDGKAFDGIEV